MKKKLIFDYYEKRIFRRKKTLFLFVFLALTGILISIFSFNQEFSKDFIYDKFTEKNNRSSLYDYNLNSVKPKSANLPYHDAIYLNGDTELDTFATNEGLPGNGSQENPYIFSGYHFIFNGTGTILIKIINTNKHFVIRDNVLDCVDDIYAGWCDYAFYLDDIDNITLINNTVNGYFSSGLHLQNAKYTNITNNTWNLEEVSENLYLSERIYFGMTSYCNFTNNSIIGEDFNKNLFRIYSSDVWFFKDNLIEGRHFYNKIIDIDLWSSYWNFSNNIITGETFDNTIIYLDVLSSFWNFSNNTINGSSYSENVFYIGSSDVNISDNIINGSSYSRIVFYIGSSDVNISDNIINGSSYSGYVFYIDSNDVNISNNLINGSSYDNNVFYIRYGNTIILNNSIISGEEYGYNIIKTASYLSHLSISNNTFYGPVSTTFSSAISLYSVNDFLISGNKFSLSFQLNTTFYSIETFSCEGYNLVQNNYGNGSYSFLGTNNMIISDNILEIGDILTTGENISLFNNTLNQGTVIKGFNSIFEVSGNSEFSSISTQNGWKGSGTEEDPIIIENFLIYNVEDREEGYFKLNDVSFYINILKLSIINAYSYNKYEEPKIGIINHCSNIQISQIMIDGNFPISSLNFSILNGSENIIVENDKGSYPIDLYIEDSSLILLNNLTNIKSLNFENSINCIIEYSSMNTEYSSINIEDSEQIALINNTIICKSINFTNSRTNVIFNNSITLFSQLPLYSYPAIHLYTTNNTNITNNLINGEWSFGIQLSGSSQNLIKDNIIKNTTDGIYLGVSSNTNYPTNNNDNVIENNKLIINEIGIWLDGIVDNEYLKGNMIKSNNILHVDSISGSDEDRIIGILLESSDSNEISNNVITSFIIGIKLDGSNNNQIKNNTIDASEYSIYEEGSRGNIYENNQIINGEEYYQEAQESSAILKGFITFIIIAGLGLICGYLNYIGEDDKKGKEEKSSKQALTKKFSSNKFSSGRFLVILDKKVKSLGTEKIFAFFSVWLSRYLEYGYINLERIRKMNENYKDEAVKKAIEIILESKESIIDIYVNNIDSAFGIEGVLAKELNLVNNHNEQKDSVFGILFKEYWLNAFKTMPSKLNFDLDLFNVNGESVYLYVYFEKFYKNNNSSIKNKEENIIYAESPAPDHDGLCSDNLCPCNNTRIPVGTGYLYIPKSFIEFRKDCLTEKELRVKVDRLHNMGPMMFLGQGIAAPILMCKEGALNRGIDLDVAAKDAKYWWKTGKVPLRETPLKKESSSANKISKEKQENMDSKEKTEKEYPPSHQKSINKKNPRVKFVRKETSFRNGFDYVYMIYSAPTAFEAQRFLENTDPIEENYHYIIVETPQGNWGMDLNGGYVEYVRGQKIAPIQGENTSKKTEAISVSTPFKGSLTDLKIGRSDKVMVCITCGLCKEKSWVEVHPNLSEKQHAQCLYCGADNSFDSPKIIFTSDKM